MLWQGAAGQSPHNRCFKSMSSFIMTTTASTQKGCHLYLYLFVGDLSLFFFNWRRFSWVSSLSIILELIKSVNFIWFDNTHFNYSKCHVPQQKKKKKKQTSPPPHTHKNNNKKNVILNSINISKCYCFCCTFDQINVGLVNRRDLFKQKNIKNLTVQKLLIGSVSFKLLH